MIFFALAYQFLYCLLNTKILFLCLIMPVSFLEWAGFTVCCFSWFSAAAVSVCPRFLSSCELFIFGTLLEGVLKTWVKLAFSHREFMFASASFSGILLTQEDEILYLRLLITYTEQEFRRWAQIRADLWLYCLKADLRHCPPPS